MGLFIEIIIGIVIAVIVYFVVHYFAVTVPSRKYSNTIKQVTDKAVISVLKDMEVIEDHSKVMSNYNADVWGRGVMTFEYRVPLKSEHPDFKKIRLELNQRLNQYSKDHKLDSRGPQTFVITDLWQMDEDILFDVAYLANQITVEYVDDLNRLTNN